jgi:hypothetical protein
MAKERFDRRKQKDNKTLMFMGSLLAAAAAMWWSMELENIFGEPSLKEGFGCLFRFGTGACAQLWFVGLDQVNMIASTLFYSGIAVTIYGLKHLQRTTVKILAALFIIIGLLILFPQDQYQHSEHIREATEEARAAINECRNKRLVGELKTHTDAVNCSNPKIIEAYRRAFYPHMDLIESFTEKQSEMARMTDAGQFSEKEANLEIARFMLYIATVEGKRSAK